MRLSCCRSAAAQCTAQPARPRRLVVAASKLNRPSAPPQHLKEQAGQPAAAPVLRPPPVRPPPGPPQAPPAARPAGQMAPGYHSWKITLAVVGDVHSQWDADSEAALHSLGADVAVFVGDFGEESVQLVDQIAAVRHPKAVILGNHDAWFSLTPNGRRRYARAMLQSSCLAVRQEFSEGGSTPAIARQLEALGTDHVGFSSKRFPALGLSLLGGRPFSKGGKQWSDVADFYAEHYPGVASMQDSAHRILDVALGAPESDCKVLVAHNGPAGLGARRHSICGVDWTEPEADFGDPDLQEALDLMHGQDLHIPLVLFGHMHSSLKGRGQRNMVEVDVSHGTIFLNAATVPRVRSFLYPAPPNEGDASNGGNGNGSSLGGAEGSSSSGGPDAEAEASSSTIQGHHFVVVELQHGVVTAARDAWVGVERSPAAGSGSGGSRQCVLLQENELLKSVLPAALAAGPAADGAAAGDSSGSAAAERREAAGGSGGDSAGRSSDNYVCSIYRGHTDEWEQHVLRLPAAARQAAL